MERIEKILTLVALMALSSSVVQAQGVKGLLNKAKAKVESIANAADRKKTADTTQSESDEKTALQTTTGRIPRSNIYEKKPREVINRFGTFKKTASTKTIQVDEFNDMVLGYYFENRAFVWTRREGLRCLDEKGNTLKTWPRDSEAQWAHGIRNMSAPKFNSGRFIICEKNGSRTDAIIYDTNFKEIKRISDVNGTSNYEDGVALLNKNVQTPYRHTISTYIDVNGNQIFKNLSEPWNKSFVNTIHMRPLCDGLAAFCVPKPESTVRLLWGFRDKDGKVVIPAQYDEVHNFSNGLAAVASGESLGARWGFIDTKGNMQIPQIFSHEPCDFDESGIAVVQDREGAYTVVDKQGKVNERRYPNMTTFCGGRALSIQNNIIYMVDKDFQIISSYHGLCWGIEKGMGSVLSDGYEHRCANQYASVGSSVIMRDDQIYMLMNDYDETVGENVHLYYGLFSNTGDLVISGMAGCFMNGLAPVYNTETGDVGYINMKGEWVVKFEKSKF